MATEGINIEGRIYDHPTQLKFFLKKADWHKTAAQARSWATVLGRNGAGKSTISTALWNYAHSNTTLTANQDQTPDTEDLQVKLIPDNEVIKENIYVFNENFIRNKLQFDSDDLGAIFMLKEQKDLKIQIDKAEQEKAEAENKAALLRYITGQCEAKPQLPNIKSPTPLSQTLQEKQKKLEDQFRGDDNWAGICRKIRNQRQNKPVSIKWIEKQYSKFSNQLLVEKEITKQQKEFDSKLANFQALRGIAGQKMENIQPPNIEFFKRTIDDIAGALSTQPDSAEKSTDNLVDIIQSNSSTVDIASTKEFLSRHPAPKYCNKCLQSIDPSWPGIVLKAIEQIESKDEIRRLQSKLDECSNSLSIVIEQVESTVIPPNPTGLNSDKDFSDSKTALERDLSNLKSRIELKKRTPYAVVRFGTVDSSRTSNEESKREIKTHFNRFISSVRNLNMLVNSYNEQIGQLKNEENELIKKVTILELSKNVSLWKSYQDSETEIREKSIELKNEENKVDRDTSIIAALKSQLSQISIAMSKINEGLRLVFLSSNRIQLKASSDDENAYAIFVRGKRVPLHDLSTGEKNAIAIAYFFSMPYEGKSENPIFDESMLFVLDDPITSLDRSNEIGIFSLIAKEFATIEEQMSNASLQVLLMTHNYHVFYAMQHVADSIFKSNAISWILSDCKLSTVDSDKPAYTYRTLIKDVYDFARSDQHEQSNVESHDYTIPNELRRALEEYSWFNFGVGGTGLRNQPLVQNKLEELVKMNRLSKESKDLILSVLYSTWTNSGSHREENVKSDLLDLDLLEYNDQEEVRKVSKLLLILLDEIHFTGLPGLLWGSQVKVGDNCYVKCCEYLETWKNEFSSK